MPGPLMLGNLFDLVCGFKPVDLCAAAANGDWIDLKNNARVGLLFLSAVGTGDDDPTLTVKQAKDKCGSCCKALNICTAKAFKKQAATDLTSTKVWASASACVCANTLTNATSAEQVAMWYVEIDSSELDNGCCFTHVQGSVSCCGICAAQLAVLTYIVAPKYPSAPADVLSSIC